MYKLKPTPSDIIYCGVVAFGSAVIALWIVAAIIKLLLHLLT